LEARRLLTSYLVNSLADTIADDGMLTFWQAIQASNTNVRVNEAAHQGTYHFVRDYATDVLPGFYRAQLPNFSAVDDRLNSLGPALLRYQPDCFQ